MQRVHGLAVHALARGVSLPRWVLTVSIGVLRSRSERTPATAATGMLGVQVRDLRAGSSALLAARALGGVCLARGRLRGHRV